MSKNAPKLYYLAMLWAISTACALGRQAPQTPAPQAAASPPPTPITQAKLNDAGSSGGIGLPTPGPSWVTQENLVMVYQANSKDKLAFDETYASAVDKGTWNGQAVYYRRQIESRQAAAVRVERAEDTNGLRFYNGGMLLDSITGTYDYGVSKNLLFRTELRRDISNLPFFNSSSGPAKQRTTLSFAQIVKF
jgi:hypothetical protein